MADLISRKALLEELDKWINPCVNYDKSEFLSGIAKAMAEQWAGDIREGSQCEK